jgi:hypothetical protein
LVFRSLCSAIACEVAAGRAMQLASKSALRRETMKNTSLVVLHD